MLGAKRSDRTVQELFSGGGLGVDYYWYECCGKAEQMRWLNNGLTSRLFVGYQPRGEAIYRGLIIPLLQARRCLPKRGETPHTSQITKFTQSMLHKPAF